MEELSLLGNFVRLADYLVVGGVMGRALAAAEDTLALLLAGREAVSLREPRLHDVPPRPCALLR